MAETQLVITKDRLFELLTDIFSDSTVAVDGVYKELNGINDINSDIEIKIMQFFVKNTSFSREKFRFKKIDRQSSYSEYAVDQFHGDGHIKLLTVPLALDSGVIFRVSIFYQSFFTKENGESVGPSFELKEFYKLLVKRAARGTKNLEIFTRRFLRVQKDLLVDDHALEAIKKSFERS